MNKKDKVNASEAKAEATETAQTSQEVQEETKTSSEAKKADKKPAEKKKFNTKKLKYGSISTAFTIIFVAVVIMLNIVVSMVAERVNFNVDLTGGTFSLSDEVVTALNGLNQPVTVMMMWDENTLSNAGGYYLQLLETLRSMQKTTSKITVEFYDINKNPQKVAEISQYYKGDLTQGDIVVRCDDRVKVLHTSDVFNYEFNQSTYGYDIVSSKAETAVATAVLYVTEANPKTACLLSVDSVSGTEYTDYVGETFSSIGYDLLTTDPYTEDIPAEADVVVLVSPSNDLPESVIDKLYNYLDNNGQLGKNLIYIADVTQANIPNIDAFLQEWGIDVGEGNQVFSTNNSSVEAYGQHYAVRTKVVGNEYAELIANTKLPVSIINACPVTPLFETKDTRTVKPLLQTDENGVIVYNEVDEDGQYKISDPGVYTAAAVSEKYTWKDNDQIYSRVSVFGSSLILAPIFTQSTAHNNLEMFTSTANVMTGKEVQITAIAKSIDPVTFTVNQSVQLAMFVTFVFILPILVLITGIVVWIRRKNK